MFVRQQEAQYIHIPREERHKLIHILSSKTSQNEIASTKQSPNTLNLPSLAAPLICCRVFWGRGEGQRCEWGVVRCANLVSSSWSCLHHHQFENRSNAGLTMMLHHRYNNAWLVFFHATSLVRATQWARRQANAFWPCRKLIEPIVSGWWQNKLENCHQCHYITLWFNASFCMIIINTIAYSYALHCQKIIVVMECIFSEKLFDPQ